MKPGIYGHLKNSEYQQDASISRSQIELLFLTELHFIHAKENPRFERKGKALSKGSALHCAVLEPWLFPKLYVRGPESDQRTVVGKDDKRRIQFENPEAEVMPFQDFDDVVLMAASVHKKKKAQELLQGGKSELSVFWKHPLEIDLKCRPDYLTEKYIIDVKTTECASPKGFLKSVLKYGYHRQAAFYRMGLIAHGWPSNTPFYFIAVESSAPYATAIYKMKESFLQIGEAEIYPLLQKLATAEKTKIYPGYSDEIEDLEEPLWLFKETIKIEEGVEI